MKAQAASPAASEYFNRDLALSADFNGDGRPEGVVGLFDDASCVAGKIHVVGRGVAPYVVDRSSPHVPGSPSCGDGFGAALAAGDFNADGFDDLVIGMPGATVSGMQRAGGIFVVPGSLNGLDWSALGGFHQDTPGLLGQSEAGDLFGFAVAAGDFNCDGFDDVAIAAPGEEASSSGADAGAVTVLFGGSAGLTVSGEQLIAESFVPAADGSEAGDRFGFSLAAFDPYDTDGSSACHGLAAGVPGEEFAGAPQNHGALVVLPWASTGLDISNGQSVAPGFGGYEGAPEAGQKFGRWIRVDWEFGGVRDLLVDLGTSSSCTVVQDRRHVFRAGSAGVDPGLDAVLCSDYTRPTWVEVSFAAADYAFESFLWRTDALVAIDPSTVLGEPPVDSIVRTRHFGDVVAASRADLLQQGDVWVVADGGSVAISVDSARTLTMGSASLGPQNAPVQPGETWVLPVRPLPTPVYPGLETSPTVFPGGFPSIVPAGCPDPENIDHCHNDSFEPKPFDEYLDAAVFLAPHKGGNGFGQDAILKQHYNVPGPPSQNARSGFLRINDGLVAMFPGPDGDPESIVTAFEWAADRHNSPNPIHSRRLKVFSIVGGECEPTVVENMQGGSFAYVATRNCIGMGPNMGARFATTKWWVVAEDDQDFGYEGFDTVIETDIILNNQKIWCPTDQYPGCQEYDNTDPDYAVPALALAHEIGHALGLNDRHLWCKDDLMYHHVDNMDEIILNTSDLRNRYDILYPNNDPDVCGADPNANPPERFPDVSCCYPQD